MEPPLDARTGAPRHRSFRAVPRKQRRRANTSAQPAGGRGERSKQPPYPDATPSHLAVPRACEGRGRRCRTRVGAGEFGQARSIAGPRPRYRRSTGGFARNGGSELCRRRRSAVPVVLHRRLRNSQRLAVARRPQELVEFLRARRTVAWEHALLDRRFDQGGVVLGALGGEAERTTRRRVVELTELHGRGRPILQHVVH